MKRVGNFFFAFVPLLAASGLQILAMMFAMGTSSLLEFCRYGVFAGEGSSAILNDLTQWWVSQRFNIYLMVIYAILSIALFGVWYYMCYGGSLRPALRGVFRPLSVLGIVLLVPGTQFLSSYLISLLASLLPSWLRAYEELLQSIGLDERLTFGLFLYSVLLAPVSEELIFRGVTLRQARKALPFWLANLFQALMFGIFHGNMLQGSYAFCLGILLGYVCERSGSIYSSILLHMLFNFWGTVLSEFLDPDYGASVFSFLFWLMCGIALTAGGLAAYHAGTARRGQPKPGHAPETGSMPPSPPASQC